MFLNLTRKSATPDQLTNGLQDWHITRIDIADCIKMDGGDIADFLTRCPTQDWLKDQLTFVDLPDVKDLQNRADIILKGINVLTGQGNDDGIYYDAVQVLLEDDTTFRPVLQTTLKAAGISCVKC